MVVVVTATPVVLDIRDQGAAQLGVEAFDFRRANGVWGGGNVSGPESKPAELGHS